jgi:TP901 family phage tail tape measure protein
VADSQVDIELRLIVGQATAAIQQLTTQVAGLDKALTGGAKGIKDVAGATDLLDRQLKRTTISAEVFRGIIGANLFFRIGKSIANGVGEAVRSMIEFESALVGVGKTTEFDGQRLADFGQSIQVMARRVPVATTELLRLAEISAQLGVRGEENLRKFVETAARLGVSTNVSAEDAVTGLKRLTIITGTAESEVDKLGSVLVALGNNFATTEAEILAMSNQLGRSTSGFGVTADQVLALSAAMTSMGIAAEGGGSAAGSVFERLSSVISKGGPDLDKFAKLTGNTAQELKDKFGKNAAEVFSEVISGLNKSTGSSVQLSKTLTELGFVNLRVRKTVRPLTVAQDEMARAFALATDEMKKQQAESALFKESEKRFATTESSIIKLGNAWTELTIKIAASTGPIKSVVDLLAKSVEYWANAFDESTQKKIIQSQTKLSDLTNQLTETTESIKSLTEQGATFSGKDYLSLTLQGQSRRVQELNTLIDLQKQKILDLQNTKVVEDKKAQNTQTKTTSIDPEIANEQLKVEVLQQIQLDKIEAVDNYWNLRNQIEDEQVEIGIQRDIERMDAESALRIADIQSSSKDALDKKLAIAKVEEDTIKQKTDRVKREIDLEEKKNKDIESSRNQFLGTMAGLARNENSTLKTIGKAAAATQIGINTVQAASSGYKWGMTLGGPALAAVFSGLAYVAGAAQLAELGKYRDGGVVGGNSFSGDQVVARVNSGEMILNRSQQANLFALANGQSSQSSQQEVVVHSTVTLDGEVVGRAVSRQVANGLKLGEVF